MGFFSPRKKRIDAKLLRESNNLDVELAEHRLRLEVERKKTLTIALKDHEIIATGGPTARARAEQRQVQQRRQQAAQLLDRRLQGPGLELLTAAKMVERPTDTRATIKARIDAKPQGQYLWRHNIAVQGGRGRMCDGGRAAAR